MSLPETEFSVREVQAFLKGAAFSEWRESQNPSGQAWRLAHLAGILMSADVAAGARCFDVPMWIDRAEDLLAEADRRVTGTKDLQNADV